MHPCGLAACALFLRCTPYCRCMVLRRRHSIVLQPVVLESNTRKYPKFTAAYCYECVARVTMLEAMNVYKP